MIIFGYRISVGLSLVIVYILLLLLAATCSSCGVRNVGLNKELSKSVNESKEESKSNISKTSDSSEEVEIKEKTNKTDEKQESRVTELFFENGMLKERITELINSKSVDKSTKDQKSLKKSKTTVDSMITNKIYRNVIITEKKKVKDIESDKTVVTNLGGWIPLVIVISILSLLYWYIKKK